MATGSTLGKILQEALVTLLQAEEEGLRLADDREVKVLKNLPEQELSQRALPVVVVERPPRPRVSSWTAEEDRFEFDVSLLFLDGCGVNADSFPEAEERLDRLAENVRAVITDSGTLGLAAYLVMESFVRWQQNDDPERVGNNLVVKSYLLTVPMIAARG